MNAQLESAVGSMSNFSPEKLRDKLAEAILAENSAYRARSRAGSVYAEADEAWVEAYRARRAIEKSLEGKK